LLIAALGDTPGWLTRLLRNPPANDFNAQEANQFQWSATWISPSFWPSAPSLSSAPAAILPTTESELSQTTEPLSDREEWKALQGGRLSLDADSTLSKTPPAFRR